MKRFYWGCDLAAVTYSDRLLAGCEKIRRENSGAILRHTKCPAGLKQFMVAL
jgi:hypothetical protein